MCQPVIMKQIRMDIAALFVALTISNQPVADFWIYHCECKQRIRECIMDGVLIVNEPIRYTHNNPET
jgi:hypothetical protein